MGVTMISRLQHVTQPIWLVMLITPFILIVIKDPQAVQHWVAFDATGKDGQKFSYLAFGAAIGVLCSLVIQIGEQVDFLRFLPDRNPENKTAW